MAVYRRRTWVDASLPDVWAFHSTIDSLPSLTPDFLNVRIESVTAPDGEPDPGVMEAGSTARLSMRPFGIGPRQYWTTVITEREAGDETAYFRDVMEEGPFPTWTHTHRFETEEGGTRVTDEVEYELPLLGPLSALGWPGFEAMFAYRHRRTKARLE